MKAMVLHEVTGPLLESEETMPAMSSTQLLLRVECCAVCRTDLHIVDGELAAPQFPLILGHQIVAYVEAMGDDAKGFEMGERVGVPWLGKTCGHCLYCQRGQENLCDHADFTGYTLNGGYAEYCVAEAQYCFVIPEEYSSSQAAPLLCAGLIGYRAFCQAGDAECIALYGFGASAHIICQVAVHMGRRVFVVTRQKENQAFARELGAEWAGSTEDHIPQEFDAALVFAPVGDLMIHALRHVHKGGKVISAGIHMSDIPIFPYKDLWGERSLSSVANLTRRDGEELLALAAKIPIQTRVTTYPLNKANEALADLREGRLRGAAVLQN